LTGTQLAVDHGRQLVHGAAADTRDLRAFAAVVIDQELARVGGKAAGGFDGDDVVVCDELRLVGAGRGVYDATRSPIDQTLSERPSFEGAEGASFRPETLRQTNGRVLRRALESDGLY